MKTRPVAFITGGAGAFGSAIAHRLHSDGFYIVVSDIDLEAAQEVVSSLDYSTAVSLDVSNEQQAMQSVSNIGKEIGTIDVLVNNAGVGFSGDTETSPIREFDLTMAINLRGAYIVTRAAKPFLTNSDSPRIVMIGSRTWLAGGNPAYTASKAGIVGLARTLTHELGPLNGTCNVVAPGPVDTPFVENMNINQREEEFERYSAITPMQRVATPDDVAAAVSFFAGPNSSFISGEVLHIAGGLQLAPKL